MARVIETQGLVKRYGSVEALCGLDLVVEENRVFGFLGPNGAGKTTAIKVMTGLAAATAGECLVCGTPLTGRSTAAGDTRRLIGYLSQEPRYYPWMTAVELLDFVGSVFGIAKAERTRRTRELLALTGLTKAAGRRIGGYSGGMKQRLGIAQAVYHRPRVVFLDEPVSALDPVGRKEVLELIEQLAEQTTVFMSTHILADVERVCSDIAIINAGRLVLQGNTRELLQQFAGDQAVLRFAAADPDHVARAQAAARAISALPGAADVVRIVNDPDAANAASDADGFCVRLPESLLRRHQPAVLRAIADAGAYVLEMGREQADLETVFMQLMQKAGDER